jgi:5-methylcytosine-specific restriction endonuclease McrA
MENMRNIGIRKVRAAHIWARRYVGGTNMENAINSRETQHVTLHVTRGLRRDPQTMPPSFCSRSLSAPCPLGDIPPPLVVAHSVSPTTLAMASDDVGQRRAAPTGVPRLSLRPSDSAVACQRCHHRKKKVRGPRSACR